MGAISADKNIPTMQSSSEDWIAWYKSFPWTMPESDKNRLFLAIWSRNKSDRANTDTLRTFLKDEAGISLSTNGIGSIMEAGWSLAHGVEDIFSFSAYSIGAFLFFGFCFFGFGVWQAFRNPEATGKILGIAAKTAAKV